MMNSFNFHNNHRWLLSVIGLSFLTLSSLIAVIPAYTVQENNPKLPGSSTLNDAELRGRMIYVSEGCQACHTQQVRSNIIDQPWGSRPSIPADYAQNQRLNTWRNTASVLGSERTGPDLTNIGVRQPGDLWHLLHLYNPRAVVPESIMPAYPWLFQEVSEVKPGQRALGIPSDFKPESGRDVIPTQKARDLVAYLVSLKQDKVPDYLDTEFQSYEWQTKPVDMDTDDGQELLEIDGAKLYSAHCKVCHQSEGQGISGAFPALSGSQYANDEDPGNIIRTVLFGLDRDNEYGAMIPFDETLTDAEIAAILNFERGSWGNDGSTVDKEQVRQIRSVGQPKDWPL